MNFSCCISLLKIDINMNVIFVMIGLDRETLGSREASNSSQGGGEMDQEGEYPRETETEPVSAHLATIKVMGSSEGHLWNGSLDTNMGVRGNNRGLSKLLNEGPEPSGKAIRQDRLGAKDLCRRKVRRKRDLGAKRDSTSEWGLSSIRGSRGEWGSEVERRLGVKRDSEGKNGLGGKEGLEHNPTTEDIDEAMTIECESLHKTFGASKPARRARRPGGKATGCGPGVMKVAKLGARHTDLASRIENLLEGSRRLWKIIDGSRILEVR
ncbi:hypothetical protein ACJIZ3_025118 [Penstemon smallii]|uniref:Uncharacterized protein n=1 Tax=Penstemon smallii TaxID=265156 RepID=A0ABD3TTX6_9LAMI